MSIVYKNISNVRVLLEKHKIERQAQVHLNISLNMEYEVSCASLSD